MSAGGCTTSNVLWNPALDDDPGFCERTDGPSHAHAGAPTHEADTDAFLVAILGEHGFHEVTA